MVFRCNDLQPEHSLFGNRRYDWTRLGTSRMVELAFANTLPASSRSRPSAKTVCLPGLVLLARRS
jgi:hypothetical protein